MWTSLELDEHGFYVLVDNEDRLLLANAKLNKTRSNVAGITRTSQSGNPWFDPSSGRFANGPAGVTVRAGGNFLKNLLNSAKQYNSDQAATLKADSITAEPGEEGHIIVRLYRAGDVVASFSAATEEAHPSNVKTGADLETPDPQEPHSTMPDGVDPEEWGRRLDAVREAAREFDPMAFQDIKEWLAGKTQREMSDHEINTFMEDVRRHRLSDLVDVLDHSIRRSVSLRSRSRRMVRVVPPRGWLRRTLANLDETDIAELHRRLRARGFSDEELESHLVNRFPQERRDKLAALVTVPSKDVSSGTKNRSNAGSGV